MAEREFRIVIPKKDNAGNQISLRVLEDIVREISDRFGGATVYPTVLGCWNPGGGRPIECEENFVVDVTRSRDDQGRPASIGLLEEDRRWFLDLARRVANQLGQEEVMAQEETDTRTTFVTGRRLESLPPGMLQRGPADGTVFRRLLLS